MSAAPLLAQADGAEEELSGHFIDEFIDLVTSPEAADRITDWLTTGFEWAVIIGLIALPLLMVVRGAWIRRYGLAVGGLIALSLVVWYATLPAAIIDSGVGVFDDGDGETVECIDAVVDEEGELVDCDGSTRIAQLRQNTVLDRWSIPVGAWVEQTVDWVDNNMKATIEVIKWPFAKLLSIVVDQWLLDMSWLTVCAAFFVVGWSVRNIRVGSLAFGGLMLCGILGDTFWRETAITLGLIGVSVMLCVVVGLPLGVLCGRVDSVWQKVRPALDAMQVVHSFVYLLPFIFFFGVGSVAATMAIVTFALPPLIRLTNLGIRQVPDDVVEASRAYGAPEWRVLTDVQLPLARPAIMTGLNQTLLLSISMLGIAAIVGAGGLGRLLFQAIANTDLALAGAAGMAFYLVAVVLDRISQPDEGDTGGLLSRVSSAWRNIRTPEMLLREPDEAGDVPAQKMAEEPIVLDEQFTSVSNRERSSVLVMAAGGVVSLIALLLPWSLNAGGISSFGRSADAVLSDESFNGLHASGGSWFGILIGVASAIAICATIVTLSRPGRGPSWLTAHGSVIFTFTSFGAAAAFVLARPSESVDQTAYSIGSGAFLALVGTIIAVGGAIAWLWQAPMAARRPLSAKIEWGKLAVSIAGVLLLLAAGYSGWTFDHSNESVITPELQAELDQIEADGKALEAQAAEYSAAAEEAEALGDEELQRELVSKKNQALADAGVKGAAISQAISKAQNLGFTLDGFESKGAGLGIWTLFAGIAALGLTLPSIGLFGVYESMKYRWSALVAGLGMVIAAISAAWILTIARVAETKLYVGVGAAIALAAGAMIVVASRGVLSEFERKKDYDAITITQA